MGLFGGLAGGVSQGFGQGQEAKLRQLQIADQVARREGIAGLAKLLQQSGGSLPGAQPSGDPAAGAQGPQGAPPPGGGPQASPQQAGPQQAPMPGQPSVPMRAAPMGAGSGPSPAAGGGMPGQSPGAPGGGMLTPQQFMQQFARANPGVKPESAIMAMSQYYDIQAPIQTAQMNQQKMQLEQMKAQLEQADKDRTFALDALKETDENKHRQVTEQLDRQKVGLEGARLGVAEQNSAIGAERLRSDLATKKGNLGDAEMLRSDAIDTAVDKATEGKGGADLSEGAKLNLNRTAKMYKDAWSEFDDAKESGDTAKRQAAADRVHQVWKDAQKAGLQLPPPSELAKAGQAPAGGAAAGARNQQQIMRVLGSGALAAKDLSNISEMPIDTKGGFFGSPENKGGLLSATSAYLKNNITDTQAQRYMAMMAGMTRTLASLETGGAATGLVRLADQINTGLSIRPGDSVETVATKLAQMRQIIETGLSSVATAPGASEEQKQKAGEMTEDVAKAIPFTVHDVNMLLKTPGKTLAQISGTIGSAAKDKPAGGATTFKYDAQGNRVP